MAAKKEPGNAIDKVVKHYRGSRTKIAVPEWEMDIYFTAVSYADIESIGDVTGLELNVQTLIFKAEDEDGNKLFRAGDKAHLMATADSKIMSRVITRMSGSGAKKKSGTKDEKDSRSDSD